MTTPLKPSKGSRFLGLALACLLLPALIGAEDQTIRLDYQFEQKHLGHASQFKKRSVYFSGSAMDGLAALLVSQTKGRLTHEDGVKVVTAGGTINIAMLLESIRRDPMRQLSPAGALRYRVDKQPETIPVFSHRQPISSIWYDAINDNLWLWSRSHHLRVWSLADQSFICDRTVSASYLSGMAHHNTGALYSFGISGKISVWDRERHRIREVIPLSGKSRRTYRSLADVRCSPCGHFLAVANGHGMITIFDPAKRQQLRSWPGTSPGRGDARMTGNESTGFRPSTAMTVASVDYHPNGKLLVSGGIDWAVKLWNSETGALLAQFPATRRSLRRTRFTANGEQLLTLDAAGIIVCWQIPPDVLQATANQAVKHGQLSMLGHANIAPTSSFAFDQNSGRLAVISTNKTLQVLALPTLEPMSIPSITVPSAHVALAWDGAGRLIMGVNDAGKVTACRILDVTSQTFLPLKADAPYAAVLREHPERHYFGHYANQMRSILEKPGLQGKRPQEAPPAASDANGF